MNPGVSAVVAGLSLSTTSGPVRGNPVLTPFALTACSESAGPLGGVVLMRMPGTSCNGSLAADAIAPSAVPGEPVMYWLAPLLPAEVTTTTPAFAALVVATADGSSFVPNAEPSDMLMTSMSLSTAHSIASTVTSVEPAQPNTRTA
jgi:hypothetical protein